MSDRGVVRVFIFEPVGGAEENAVRHWTLCEHIVSAGNQVRSRVYDPGNLAGFVHDWSFMLSVLRCLTSAHLDEQVCERQALRV